MNTLNDVSTLIFVTLNADATLQGANYLTSAGRIFKFPNRPAGFPAPTLTLRFIPADVRGEQKFKDEWLLWMNLYLQNFNDLTPDMVRASNIERRIFELLDDKGFLDSNIERLLINRYNLPASMTTDPEAQNETVWLFQYYTEASL